MNSSERSGAIGWKHEDPMTTREYLCGPITNIIPRDMTPTSDLSSGEYVCAACGTAFDTEQDRERHLYDMGLLY